MNITLAPGAERFIRRMLRFTTSVEAGFRLRVKPGGCSGLAAEFDIEPQLGERDQLWSIAGLRIFLDAESALLLDGATVDFVDSMAQTGFVFKFAGLANACCGSAGPPQLITLARLSSPTA
jgi:iron-sulfur cluster assembly accessory protein